jgi:hypothetical protein
MANKPFWEQLVDKAAGVGSAYVTLQTSVKEAETNNYQAKAELAAAEAEKIRAASNARASLLAGLPQLNANTKKWIGGGLIAVGATGLLASIAFPRKKRGRK